MFVTAHFHYTLLGGAMIGATAAVCYWFPKMTGRMLNERIGKVAFWMIAIGIQVTYFGQFWEGFQGMARRVAYYDPNFLTANQMSTIGAYILMTGWLVFLYMMIHSLAARASSPRPTRGTPRRSSGRCRPRCRWRTSWSTPWSPRTPTPTARACRTARRCRRSRPSEEPELVPAGAAGAGDRPESGGSS